MRIRNVIYPFYDQVLEMRAWKALAVLRSGLRQSVNFEGFFTNHKSIFTIFPKWLKLVITSWKRLV